MVFIHVYRFIPGVLSVASKTITRGVAIDNVYKGFLLCFRRERVFHHTFFLLTFRNTYRTKYHDKARRLTPADHIQIVLRSIRLHYDQKRNTIIVLK